MSKDKLEDWDEVAANNLDMGGISLAENVMRPPAVNNEMREHMAQVSKWLGDDTIVAASTTDLGTVPGRYISVTGNTTITAFGTLKAGTIKYLKFTGTPTITYNATSMILPGALSLTAAAGDTAIVVSEGSGNWRLVAYQRASGSPAVLPNDAYRNRMVNSNKAVSQENGQTSGTTNGRYLSDQNAMFFVSSAGTFTGVNVLTLSPAGGYRDRITITVPDASVAAGEYLTYTQNLEASNTRDFKWGAAGANPIVIRMGFRGPTGTYAIALHNNGATRSYVALFTISAAQTNTDTVQTFAIPGDVTGTWLTAEGVIGVTMDVVLTCGTTFQGTTGWQAGNIFGTSAVSFGMATSGAVFEFFDFGMKLDPNGTGIYGTYEITTDAVYRPERYVGTTAIDVVFLSDGAGRLVQQTVPFDVMCKTPSVVAVTSGTIVNASAITETATSNKTMKFGLTGTGAGAMSAAGRVVFRNARLS